MTDIPQRSTGPGTAPAAGFPVPAAVHRVEEVIQRSRFVTTLARARTADEVQRFVDTVRAEFPDATHHCWAFVAGPPGSSAAVGMSDDGEPHGTAGRPMLNVLLHADVGEVVAVCTRWYGGTKLGTGGLSRAYSGGVVLALETLPRVQKVDRVTLDVAVPFQAVDSLERLQDRFDLRIVDRSWDTEAHYRCEIPAASREEFEAAVGELTRGEGEVTRPTQRRDGEGEEQRGRRRADPG